MLGHNTTAKPTKLPVDQLHTLDKRPQTDDKIIAELLILDKNIIAAAREAEKKAEFPEVREYAKYLVKHHSMSLKQTLEISRKLKTPPEDSYRAMNMHREGEREMIQLRTLDQSDFDSVFVNDMIRDHRFALSLLDDDLTKVTHPLLKDHIMRMHHAVEENLHKASALK